MSLKPGDLVEHFTILAAIGQGGMGQVYLARDERLKRNVALKVVHPADASNPSAQGSDGAARLLREAQSAAALEHPNVVTIYEVGEIRTEGEEHGRPFIAMELIKGRSLRPFVGDASISIATRLRWLADIARALGAAHRAGLVHRDIKPENVMVREDGVIKVLDFGVAKRAVTPSLSSSTSTEAQVIPSLTGRGVAVGTPYYMAPEQMRREPLDGRADQFSWGVVAYELLSGSPPWGRDVDALELVSKLLSSEPAPLAEVCPEVPPHVAAVVARAMVKRKTDRFATMEALVTELEDAAGVFAPTVQFASLPPGAAEARVAESPPPRSGRGRRTLVGLLFAGVTVLLAGGAAGIVLRQRAAGRTAAASVASAASAPECVHNTECVAKSGGKAAVCNRGQCALVESKECKALYEPDDLGRDDIVWLGAMFPLSGAGASYGVSNRDAVELARRDFAQARGSLRSPDGTAPVRPLAVVLCDDQADAPRVAAHLVHELRVPAVIGCGTSKKTVDLATSLFVPNDVMMVAPIALTPVLASIPHAPSQPRLVWRTTYDNAETAPALAALVERFEAGRPGARTPTRVALVRRKDPNHAAFAQAFFDAVRFNGKPALENGDGYREFSFDAIGGKEDRAGAAASVARFGPDVVVILSDSGIVPEIEDAWSPSRRARPTYLTTPAFDDLLRFIGKDPDRRRRVRGLTSVSTTRTNARFVLHYNETFAASITRTLAPNSAYDAFYLVGYATYALGAGPVDGRTLAEAIARLLPPGPTIDVGSGGILAAFDALRRGEHIDLNGATGSMDFDLRTGEAPVDLAVVCARVGDEGVAVEGIESGLVYDAKLKKLVGEPKCP